MELKKSAERLKWKYKIVEEEHEDQMEAAWDDVTGAELDPDKVRTARKEEVEYIRKMGLYNKVNETECWKQTGKAPIKVRWIDVNKGDIKDPNYRSRLVAK